MEDLVDDLMVVVMMIKRTRMRLEVVFITIGEIIPIISMIKTIEEVEEVSVEVDKEKVVCYLNGL